MKAHEHIILEIARERERQMAEEGEAPETNLVRAAAAYAVGAVDAKNPRADLIRAAALIVAEIERLDRLKADGEEV